MPVHVCIQPLYVLDKIVNKQIKKTRDNKQIKKTREITNIPVLTQLLLQASLYPNRLLASSIQCFGTFLFFFFFTRSKLPPMPKSFSFDQNKDLLIESYAFPKSTKACLRFNFRVSVMLISEEIGPVVLRPFLNPFCVHVHEYTVNPRYNDSIFSPKMLPLKWICCCKESYMDWMICKKTLFYSCFLTEHMLLDSLMQYSCIISH